MALPFFQIKKRQKYLYWVLLVAVLIGAIWFGRDYLVKPSSPSPPPKEKKIEINYKILEDSTLQGFQLFEEILPFEGETGRNNPFLPYSPSSPLTPDQPEQPEQ